MEKTLSFKAKVDFSEEEEVTFRLKELERHSPYLPRNYYNESKEILKNRLMLTKIKSENEIK